MSFNLQRLKAERMAEGYTQEEFAKKLGMSRGAYAKREAGKEGSNYGKESISC